MEESGVQGELNDFWKGGWSTIAGVPDISSHFQPFPATFRVWSGCLSYFCFDAIQTLHGTSSSATPKVCFNSVNNFTYSARNSLAISSRAALRCKSFLG